MRIGMILDGTFPPDPRVENEAISLINEGHEVHLFCLSFSKEFKERESINEINIHRFYCNKLTYKLSALAYSTPFYHLLLKSSLKLFIISNNIEAIHIHDIQIARSLFWINKSLKKKIVLDLHENRPEIMKFYTHVNTFIGKLLIHPSIWKKYEYKYIKKANDVIVVTDGAKKYYHRHTKKAVNRIHVVPNSIREEFYTNYSINKEIIAKYSNFFTILYFGDTGERRGTFELIKSIELLKNNIPKIKLVIVGKSKDDFQLKKLTKHYNLEPYVDLVGWQNVDLFQSYLCASKIGVSPLHRNLHHDTTYANKIFQYLSFGIPVVVSDSTAQKEFIEENKCGLIHKEKSKIDIAEKILELYNNQDLYSRLKENALQTITTKYHWEKTVKQLLKVYQKE